MKQAGRLTVLIVGGYGTFGGRLCDLLADEPRLTLIVAGRSLARATAFCARPSQAKLVPAVVDRNAGVAAAIAAHDPDIVVDASGPFQAYTRGAYAVVEAALAAGADYLDLADSAALVAGITALDARTRGLGRFVLSGASSFPVLTAAVVRRLAGDLQRIDTIAAGIAPSPYAGVGINVIRAIASYAGKPVRVIADGEPVDRPGLVASVTRTIVVPGHVPLGPVRYSLVDVPDLVVLPALWPGLRSIFTGAGPTPAILHRALSALAWLVHVRVLPSLSPFAGLMDWCVNHLRWGEHRGGMFVDVTGIDRDGWPAARRWNMLAEGDAGPLVPSMAAEIVIRACLDSKPPAAGARAAGPEIDLADYERRFAARGIVTAIDHGAPDSALPIYRQMLGAAYDQLSAPIQRAHDVTGTLVLSGRARVEPAANPIARLIGRIVGFPPAADDRPVTVTLSRVGECEIWARNFDGHAFRSVQYRGTGRNEGLIVERFGPIAFAIAMVVRDGQLHLVQRRWTFFGIPMPRFLLPTGAVYEHDADGRFNFHVDVVLPVVGRVAGYRGWLVPA
ncbi:MAG: DUF4166 domain-containing protein [Bauldia sp.]